MKFEEAIEKAKAGMKVTHPHCGSIRYLVFNDGRIVDDEGEDPCLFYSTLVSDEWVEWEEQKITITRQALTEACRDAGAKLSYAEMKEGDLPDYLWQKLGGDL